MSDFNSSLPIRTELDGDVVVKISDGTTPAQHLKVNVDGSVNITDNAGSLTVDAIDLDIRDLSHIQDSVKIGDGTDFVAVNTDGSLNITDNGGSLTVDANNLDIRDLVFATDKVDASGSVVALDSATLAALESITVQNPAGAGAVNIQDGGNSITVDATALDIRSLVAATDSVAAWLKDATGAAFSNSNPLPVTITDAVAGATEVLDFKQASAVAANASDTHTYTVTAGKSLKLAKIQATASGKIKVEIKFGATLKVVLFNSTAETNVEYEFKAPEAHAAGTTINVVITNLDKAAMDLYSTVEGYEL